MKGLEKSDVKIICHKCSKYCVSPGGTTETCFAQREGSRHIIWMDDYYVEQRIIGEKKSCKAFKKI